MDDFSDFHHPSNSTPPSHNSPTFWSDALDYSNSIVRDQSYGGAFCSGATYVPLVTPAGVDEGRFYLTLYNEPCEYAPLPDTITLPSDFFY